MTFKRLRCCIISNKYIDCRKVIIKKLKSLEILLVEDEPQIQEHYKEVFEYFFQTVHVASNGKEALEIYNQENISAVFTDYEMPLLDGYSLAKALKRIDPEIPITILSNYDDKEKLQKCIPLGLSGYLFKPLYYEDIKNYLIQIEENLPDFKHRDYKFSNQIKINFWEHTITVNNKKYTITKLESAFLELMSQNENRVLAYESIFEYLYDFNATFSTIKNLVYRLKTKYQFTFIKNIKDVGYILVKDA